MEIPLRAALIAWLATDPLLATQLNAVTEEAPSRASPPWLAIAASASIDWSCKSNIGREVRVAVELHCRGDQPDAAGDIVAAIQQRVTSLPRDQGNFAIVSMRFVRARVEQRAASTRAILLEYSFRALAA